MSGLIWSAEKSCKENQLYAVQPRGWTKGGEMCSICGTTVCTHCNKCVYLLQQIFLVRMNANNITAVDYTLILQVIHIPQKQLMKEQSVAWMMAHEEGEKLTRVNIARWL